MNGQLLAAVGPQLGRLDEHFQGGHRGHLGLDLQPVPALQGLAAVLQQGLGHGHDGPGHDPVAAQGQLSARLHGHLGSLASFDSSGAQHPWRTLRASYPRPMGATGIILLLFALVWAAYAGRF